MNWHELTLQPRDLLFFRDAKPMEASSVGCGANWPMPNALHDALIHSFKARWPQRQSWEFEHKHKNAKDKRTDFANLRFGGLQSIGAFPCIGDSTYFPTPADLDSDGNVMGLKKRSGASNLPDFITHGCVSVNKSKKAMPLWVNSDQMSEYLDTEKIALTEEPEGLYDVEHRPGIEIDPATGSTVDSKFYLAEYIRLRDGVALRGYAKCISSFRGESKADVIQEFYADNSECCLVMGGQQGLAACRATGVQSESAMLPGTGSRQGRFVKWVLLTPAIFINGWLPGWVDDDGRVQLPAERPARGSNESRVEWRARCARLAKPLKARLIAAVLKKPTAISGWNLRIGGPRPSRLAAPAGSVYWFEAETEADAQVLCQALHAETKSDFYGEKGFGAGICVQKESI